MRKFHLDFRGLFQKDSEVADIEITFEGTDPPEAMTRINDHILSFSYFFIRKYSMESMQA